MTNSITGAAPLALMEFTDTQRSYRYAQILSGLDADGKPRCLALTWDGVWHPINPATGNRLVSLLALYIGDRFIHNGVTKSLVGYHVPGHGNAGNLAAQTDPADGATWHTIHADTIVEVLP
jgi:hypothetical protein